MARIRSVHPDLHRDKTLALASASAERTFVRLWCHLDDDGRGEDDLDLLKADLYPRHRDMDDAAIDLDLDELVGLGLVIRYEVDGVRYLACKPATWANYQRPQKKVASTLPPPPDNPPPPRRKAPLPVDDPSDTGKGEVAPVVVGEGSREKEKENQEHGAPERALVNADTLPVRLPPDTTWHQALMGWCERNEYTFPPPETRADVTRCFLEVAFDEVGDEKHRHRMLATELIREFLEDVTGVALEDAAKGHLRAIVGNRGAVTALRMAEQAVMNGAGQGEYAGDPKAVTKYIAAIARGEPKVVKR